MPSETPSNSVLAQSGNQGGETFGDLGMKIAKRGEILPSSTKVRILDFRE